MTREEAIERLREMKDECNDKVHKVRYVTKEEALKIAISVLEQKPCDAISREDALKCFEEFHQTETLAVGYIRSRIRQLPSVTPKPIERIEYGTDGNAYKMWVSNGKEFEQEPSRRKGHWIHLRCDMYECSECGKIHTSFEIGKCDADYCQKCGAEME